MKKIIAILALAATTSLSFSQGVINWNNTAGTLISLNGSALPANSPISPETSFHFALFIAPVGTAAPSGGLLNLGLDDENWQQVAGYAVNSTAAAGAGRFQNPGTATVNGFAAGTSVHFLIRGWQSTTGGADWGAARLGLTYIGQSAVGTALLGGGPIPTPSAFGVGEGQIGGFNLAPVPEPSSLALAGLGAASLLIFRRRK